MPFILFKAQRSACRAQIIRKGRPGSLGSILLTQIVGTLFLGCLMSTMMLVPGVMRFAQWIGAVDRGGYRKVFQGQTTFEEIKRVTTASEL